MSERLRHRGLVPGLAALSFGVAFAQRPGRFAADTKIDLYVDPGRFLGDVATTWRASIDLGHVHAGQYVGYLFPMGPFFALGHALGLAPWVVHRLWLGTLLALAAWGTVRLLDAVLPERRGPAHLVAGAAVVVCPYVLVFANRTSITLLAYAALPWMLLAVHRGVREPRGWYWPAAFALLVAATAGGVNAAVTAWTLPGPLLLLVYEVAVAGVVWRAARGFLWRAALLSLIASLWWIGPVLVHAKYGLDFLRFVEQPGTVWGTTSIPETLRQMGYWITYEGVAFAGRAMPVYRDAPTMLFSVPVVLASLLVPALAVAGFLWTRRWRYGPFFLALLLLGTLIVVTGFPEGTPLRHGLYFAYNHITGLDFLRTTYKAGSLVALPVAVLLGVAFGQLWRRVGRAPLLRVGMGVAVAGLLAAASWPLVQGRAVGLVGQPAAAAWRQAAAGLNRDLPTNARALVLPGQLFGYYRWGKPVDPILPALTDRPVAVREIVPYSDLRSTDVLWTIDRLVRQGRAYPGQLSPLLSLIGAGAVVTGTDDDLRRSGGMSPAAAARVLAAAGLRGARPYGPVRRFRPPVGDVGPTVALPEVRRYDRPAGRPLVRVEPGGPALVVDGSAEALAGLAAFGALPAHSPILYAADQSPARLRSLARQGAEVVVSDTNRRRVYVNSRPAQTLGWTLTTDDPISHDAAVLNPFADRGTGAQTVARLTGVRYIRGPFSPGFSQFPEHRPFAAFDGRVSTEWLADKALDPPRRWLEVGFDRPRRIGTIEVMPADDQRGQVRAIEVGGHVFPVHSGWNRLALGGRTFSKLRFRMAAVAFPPNVPGGAGGLREVRIRGVRVGEWLRPPVDAESALAGADLRHAPLAYLFTRTTGDDPLHRQRYTGPPQAHDARDRGDGEDGLRREFSVPAARSWRADALLSVSPLAPDDALDRLAGYRGPVRATSASRFQNRIAFRASGAFDGTRARAWVGEWIPGRPAWIAWHTPRPTRLRSLRLAPSLIPQAAIPSAVRVRWPGGTSPRLPVGPGGIVRLPRAVTSRSFTLDVLAVRVPPGAAASRAVAIGEIRVPGLPITRVPAAGRLRAGCGSAAFRVGGSRVALRPLGDVSGLERQGTVRAAACGARFPLPAGPTRLIAGSGLFRIDYLRLRSPAPAGAGTATGGGRVVDVGHRHRASWDGVDLAVRGPSWLVLGESYSPGWRAWCDGHSLGSPTPIDGYANGWRIDRGCRQAHFAFAPETVAKISYLLSVPACLAMLALLLLRRRRGAAPAGLGELEPDDHPRRWPAPRAAAVGLAAGVVLGFVFSIRSGVVIAPAVAFLLWRGIGARTLIAAAAGLLLVVVPILYVVVPVKDRGGWDFDYPVERISAHWVAVAALILLGLALVRSLRPARAAAKPDGGG